MHYASPQHERLYKNITRGKDYPASTMAALYLLTAKRKLWKSYCKAVNNQGIEWAASRDINSGWDGYYLERAALSLTKRTDQAALAVTLYDLTNPTEYPQELLRLVVTAVWIARNRPSATKNIIIQKGRTQKC
jgi:hypothetical protein